MKTKTFIISFYVLFFAVKGFSQTGNCQESGFQYTYDAAGNRTSRVYYVINNLQCPGDNPTSLMANKVYEDDAHISTANNPQNVDAIYPNPTTGICYVTCSNALKNATLSITNVNGKVVQQFVINGSKQIIDISNLANGIYFVNVYEKERVLHKKIIKQ